MIDTDRYDNEGIELTDGGTICFPEDDGRIQRIDKDGNIMQTLHPEDTEWQEWYELFDTHKDLLAEVERLREQNKLMVDYFRFMRDGGFTDDDWRTVNEWIGDD